MLICWFVGHLDSQVLGHNWSRISSPLLSLPRSPPYHPWHGNPGCVQYSMCSACSHHRQQSWSMIGQGDGPSPLLILCSLIGNSLATGAELLDQRALVESGPRPGWRASGEGRWGVKGSWCHHFSSLLDVHVSLHGKQLHLQFPSWVQGDQITPP